MSLAKTVEPPSTQTKEEMIDDLKVQFPNAGGVIGIFYDDHKGNKKNIIAALRNQGYKEGQAGVKKFKAMQAKKQFGKISEVEQEAIEAHKMLLAKGKKCPNTGFVVREPFLGK